MKYKIGIFGSAADEMETNNVGKAKGLAKKARQWYYLKINQKN